MDQAAWRGWIKDGKGAISTKSGALKGYPYGFSSRFEGKPGTRPEELIGVAHAGCFIMALALIAVVPLTLKAKVPGADKAKLEELANKAKAECPVLKASECRNYDDGHPHGLIASQEASGLSAGVAE